MFKRLRDARPEWRLQAINAAGFVGVVVAAVVIGGDDLASRVEIAAFFLGTGGMGLLFFRRKTDRLARNLFFAAVGTLVLATAVGIASNEAGGGTGDPAQGAVVGIAGSALAIGFVGAIVVVLRGVRKQPDAAEPEVPTDQPPGPPTGPGRGDR